MSVGPFTPYSINSLRTGLAVDSTEYDISDLISNNEPGDAAKQLFKDERKLGKEMTHFNNLQAIDRQKVVNAYKPLKDSLSLMETA